VVHRIVQFDHQPNAADLAALVADGYTIAAAIPDNALLVSGRRPIRQPGVIWQGLLLESDKISPAISESRDFVLHVLVDFHSDVEPEAQNALGAALGFDFVRLNFLLPNHVLVDATLPELQLLARRDEVAYIFPADPDWPSLSLSANEAIACAGMLTLAGPVAQYANTVHGWDLDTDHIAHLGYYFGGLTAKVPSATVKSEILRAMNSWAAAASITFSASSSDTALRTVAVKFASRAHGDSMPFDGPAGVVGHTFYPTPVNSEPIAGDLHLDADENWHAGSDLDIYSVVLHEMGHALGLSHSDKPGDVMYPYYRRGMVLSKNDIGAIQALYGAASAATLTLAPVISAGPQPIKLIFNPPLPPGAASQISISGAVSGGVAPVSLEYQTSTGSSGHITVDASGNWTATVIGLLPGVNTITVTAYDAAKVSGSVSASVNRTAVASTTAAAPVSIRITAPANAVSSSKSATLSVAGSATGGTGVTQVTWQTSNGKTGTATGTNQWVANIPLLTGTNTIVMRAYDGNGASGWASLVVVRQ